MCIRDRCGWGRRRPTDLQRLGRGATLPRFDLPQTPPLPQSTPALSPKTPTNPSDEAEKEWETQLQNLAKAEAELFRREQQRPRLLSEADKKRVNTLGSDLRLVWTAPTTSDRDRKERLRTLLEEVILKVERKESHADLTLCWRGGMTTKLDLPMKRYQAQGPTTDEDTMSLLRRLAAHYPDDTIAGILNRQGRKTAYGERFTAQHVGSLRRYHEIPRFEPSHESPPGEVVPVMQAAKILGVAPSTLHRWL